MNLPANGGMGGQEPEWKEAEAKFHETLKKHSKPYAGFYMGPADDKMKETGKKQQLMMISADVLALAGMYQQLVSAKGLFSE